MFTSWISVPHGCLGSLCASGGSSEPTQGRPCHLHLSPASGALLSAAWEESQEAWSDFWTAKGDKMNCPFSVTDFQSGIHSEVSNYLPEWHSAFESSSHVWQVDLEHVLTQPCMASCKAPSLLRFSRACSGCSQVDPKACSGP